MKKPVCSANKDMSFLVTSKTVNLYPTTLAKLTAKMKSNFKNQNALFANQAFSLMKIPIVKSAKRVLVACIVILLIAKPALFAKKDII